MKKWIWIPVLLVVVPAAALTVFIATFDANRYRPQVAEALGQALGGRAEVGQMRLSWRGGPALEVRGLSVTGDEEPPALEVERASAVVEFLPLLSRQVRIGSIRIDKPVVRLRRQADGRVGLTGLKPRAASPSSDPSAKNAAAPSLAVGIASFVLTDAEIHFEDLGVTPSLNLVVRDLDAEVKGFSLEAPFSFAARAAVFAAKQNIDLRGTLRLPRGAEPAELTTAAIGLDLGEFDRRALIEAFPASAASLPDRMAGTFNLRAERLSLGPDILDSARASLELKDGEFALSGLSSELRRMELDAALDGRRLTLRSLEGQFAGGSFRLEGVVDGIDGNPSTSLRLNGNGFELAELLPGRSGAPGPVGRFDLEFEGGAFGASAPQILGSLGGRGRVALPQGVRLNMNLLAEALRKASVVPGLGENLRDRLPPQWRVKLDEGTTVLFPFELPFTAERGVFVAPRFSVSTELIKLDGGGQFSAVDRSVHAQGVLRIAPGFSQALTVAAPAIAPVMEASGELAIPLRIDGVPPAVTVLPDTQYLTQKIATAQIGRLAQNLTSGSSEGGANPLGALLGGTAPAPSAGAGASASPSNSTQQLLGALLGGDGSQ